MQSLLIQIFVNITYSIVYVTESFYFDFEVRSTQSISNNFVVNFFLFSFF
jgi:hypothetical protein